MMCIQWKRFQVLTNRQLKSITSQISQIKLTNLECFWFSSCFISSWVESNSIDQSNQRREINFCFTIPVRMLYRPQYRIPMVWYTDGPMVNLQSMLHSLYSKIFPSRSIWRNKNKKNSKFLFDLSDSRKKNRKENIAFDICMCKFSFYFDLFCLLLNLNECIQITRICDSNGRERKKKFSMTYQLNNTPYGED